MERFDSNFKTTAQYYKFEWIKTIKTKTGLKEIKLSTSEKRKNSKNETVEIIEYMNQPQPGIVLTLNNIEVVILLLQMYHIISEHFSLIFIKISIYVQTQTFVS